jgi:hypothetical protein
MLIFLFFVRYCCQTGQVQVYHIKGDKFQLADIGTKSGINQEDFDFKLSHMEVPMVMMPKVMANYARRGVKKSSSIPIPDPSEDPTSTEDQRFIPGITPSPESRSTPDAKLAYSREHGSPGDRISPTT